MFEDEDEDEDEEDRRRRERVVELGMFMTSFVTSQPLLVRVEILESGTGTGNQGIKLLRTG